MSQFITVKSSRNFAYKKKEVPRLNLLYLHIDLG